MKYFPHIQVTLFSLLSAFQLAHGQSARDSQLVVQWEEKITSALAAGRYPDSLDSWADQLENLYLAQGQWRPFVTNRIDLSKQFLQAGFPEKQLQILLEAEKRCLEEPGSPFLDGIYYELGLAFYSREQWAESQSRLQKYFDLPRQSQVYYENHANAHNLSGVVQMALGNPEKAIAHYLAAVQTGRPFYGANHDRIAVYYNNLGNGYRRLGLLDKAADALQSALDIRQKSLGPDHPRTGSILLNLGAVLDDKGDYPAAIDIYKKALPIFSGKDKEREADLHINLGIAHKNLGAYDEAILHYQKSLGLYRALEEKPQEKIANALMNLGVARTRQNDFKTAITDLDEALKINLRVWGPGHVRVSDCYTNLGFAHSAAGNRAQSLDFHQKALEILRENPEWELDAANTRNNISDALFHLGRLEEAKAYLDSSLEAQSRLLGVKHPALAYSRNSLAKIYTAKGRFREALAETTAALAANHKTFQSPQDALPPLEGYLNAAYFFESLLLDADIRQKTGADPSRSRLEAQKRYLLADSLLARLREELTSREDKIALAQNTARLSRAAIRNELELARLSGNPDHLERAFYFSEQSKATVLLNAIAADKALHFAGLPDSIIALEGRLQADIRFYRQQLAAGPDSARAALFQNELFDHQQKYNTLLAHLKTGYPFYYDLRHEKLAPQVRAIQFALPEQTSLLSYFSSDSTLYVFLLEKHRYEVKAVPLGREWKDDLLGFVKGIARRLDQVYLEKAGKIYPTLFPVRPDKNTRRLVLVPDGSLAKLPFEALLTTPVDPGETPDFSSLPYLLRDYEMVYAPSVSLYYQQIARQTQPPDPEKQPIGLLAVAPVFSDDNQMAESSQALAARAVEPEDQAAFSRGGGYIVPLPGSLKESQAISNVFRVNKLPAATFFFGDATEAGIKNSALSAYQYLHIATHGFINEKYPDLSGLILYPDSTSAEDGILTAGEVYGLKLNADLVVLSACETGIGKIAEGEGLLGLSRAFIYAGAKNLAVSLWKVSDTATADLMTGFYTSHLENTAAGFASSLRKAKLNMIRSGENAHPNLWSAFVLLGN